MDNKLKIVNFLGKNAEKAFTMHELSKLTKIPYATFYRTISKMSDLIMKTKAGKATRLQRGCAWSCVLSFASGFRSLV
jgi:hypothetical protein